MNIRFTLRNVNPKTQIGTVNIYLDFYSQTFRRQLFLKTPVKVEKNYWNSKTQKIGKTYPNCKALTELLNSEFQAILDTVNELKYDGEEITPEKIQAYRQAKNEGIKDVITLAKDYIQLRTDAKSRMIEKLNNLVTRLQEFQEKNRKGKALYYSELNQKFIYDFTKYLQDENSKFGSQQPSTINKTFGFLKQILNDYHSKGIINNNYKSLIYPKPFEQAQMIFTGSEIKQIISYTPKIKRLEKVKDLALLQLYTGLRYSDASKINESNFYENSLNISTKKTNEDISIPLHPALLKLVERYNYDLSKLVISNVKYNLYLKELIEKAGITSKSKIEYFVNGQKVTTYRFKYDLVGSHTFRRTFITNAIIQGIPLHVIQSITGHKTLKELSKYVNIADEVKKVEMNKLNSLFSVG